MTSKKTRKNKNKTKIERRRTRRQKGGAIKGWLKAAGGVGKGLLGFGYYSALTLSPLIFYKYVSEGERYEKKWNEYSECIKENSKSKCKKNLYRSKKDDDKMAKAAAAKATATNAAATNAPPPRAGGELPAAAAVAALPIRQEVLTDSDSGGGAYLMGAGEGVNPMFDPTADFWDYLDDVTESSDDDNEGLL